MRKVEKRKKRLFRKNVRNLICVVMMIVLIFNITMVDAGSNDSKIEKNKVDGIYAVTNISGVDRIFYLNMYTLDDRISYCIELGVDITSDIYSSTYDFYLSNLSEEQIKYIKNVSYFGYGYSNHSDIKYYMAAQEIIWEYLSGNEIGWTNVMDVNGERINIESYKEEIMTLVNDYYRGINLDTYVSDMDVLIGQEVVISDINNNLKYYDVIAGEHGSANIIDDKLYIKFDTDYVGQDVVVLMRKQVYDYDVSLYYQDSSQKLISNGNIDEEIELRFNIKGKDIYFQLKDSVDIKHNGQFSYSGIAYELFSADNKYFGRITSDAYGSIVVRNMPYGKYHIRGIGVNRAYYFDYIDYYFDFFSDDIVYLEAHPIVNEIKVLKLFGDDDELEVEKGVIFEVYNVDGSFYDDFITGADGVGIIDVPYGKYVIKQKTSSYGYYMVEDFSVDATKRKSEAISYTLVDEQIQSNLVINSKDEDGNFVIEDGISYKIKRDSEYLEFDGITEFQSIDGIMILSGKLAYGDYIVEVINNSNNYMGEVGHINLSIGDNSNFILQDNELWLEVDVNYLVKKGNVKVVTFKEEVIYDDNNFYYDYIENDNVMLDVIASEDIIVNGKVVYKSGEIVKSIVTDGKGEYLIEDIYLGKYCLVGEKIENCFEARDKVMLEVKIVTKLEKGNVNIHNLTSDMEDIMGTTIDLINKDGQVIYVGVTNEEGLVKINELAYGDYCIKESNVSDYYLLNEDEICFSINSSEPVKLEFVNKKIGKKVIDVPNTFSDKKSIRKLIMLVIMMFLGGIIYRVKVGNKVY